MGTRQGAFVLAADGQRERWEVSGRRFGGWECSRRQASPVEPHRLDASQPSGWGGSRQAGFDHHLVEPVDPEVIEALLAAPGALALAGQPR